MKKISRIWIYPFLVLGILLMVTSTCKKDETGIPALTTTAVRNITSYSATCGGNISSDGGSAISIRGVCWSPSGNPCIYNFKSTDGAGTGSFTSSITALMPNMKYYVRAYVTNSEGTFYGEVLTFTTTSDIIFNPNLTYGNITDIEGNVYKTIKIGTQTWMAENLRTTKFNDGTPIEMLVKGDSIAYCWYDNNPANKYYGYGALYTWRAKERGTLAPVGWHVPTHEDWVKLVEFLGGDSVAGAKLKQIGTTHWLIPNIGATNESGFTALPGGFRRFWHNKWCDFEGANVLGSWWDQSGGIWIIANTATSINTPYENSQYPITNLPRACSVRCIKNSF